MDETHKRFAYVQIGRKHSIAFNRQHNNSRCTSTLPANNRIMYNIIVCYYFSRALARLCLRYSSILFTFRHCCSYVSMLEYLFSAIKRGKFDCRFVGGQVSRAFEHAHRRRKINAPKRKVTNCKFDINTGVVWMHEAAVQRRAEMARKIDSEAEGVSGLIAIRSV